MAFKKVPVRLVVKETRQAEEAKREVLADGSRVRIAQMPQVSNRSMKKTKLFICSKKLKQLTTSWSKEEVAIYIHIYWVYVRKSQVRKTEKFIK